MTDTAPFAFSSRRSQRVAFAAAAGTVAIFRLVVLLTGGAPATIDAGNWIAFGQALVADSSRSGELVYPPLVPLLTYGATTALGFQTGVAVTGALSSVMPGAGVFWALGRCQIGRVRLVASILMLGVGSVGEAAAWGGFPQLIGFGLLPVAVVAVDRWLSKPSVRAVIVPSCLVFAVFATSHFVALILVVALPVVLARHLLLAGTALKPRMVLIAKAALLVVPLLLLASTYWKLAGAAFGDDNAFAELDDLTWGNVLDRLEHVYAEWPLLWRLLVPLSAITPFVKWAPKHGAAVRLVRVLWFALIVVSAVTRESRYLYLVPLIALVASSIWLEELEARTYGMSRRTRGVVVAAVGICAVWQMTAGIGLFDDQRYFYGPLTRDLTAAIETAGDATTDGRRIAVPSLDGTPVGWWVEALGESEALYGSSLRWLVFPDEIERATAANRVFRPDFPASDSLGLLREADVETIVLPRTWRWFDYDAVTRWAYENELETLLVNADAVVLRVGLG